MTNYVDEELKKKDDGKPSLISSPSKPS